MYQEQRLEKILTLLEERGSLSVKEMVDALGVSKDTVRRDFDCLSQRGIWLSVPMVAFFQLKIPLFLASKNVRKNSLKTKKKLADLALSFVKDQSLLFFDVSTLMLEVSQKLTKSVTVYSPLFGHCLGPKWQRRNRLSSLGRKILQQKPLSTIRFTKLSSCNIYSLT